MKSRNEKGIHSIDNENKELSHFGKEQSGALVKHLLMKRDDLEAKKQIADERLKKAPAGTLRIVKRGKQDQYYHRECTKDTIGKYIKKSNKDLIHALAQKDYDKRLTAELGVQCNLIEYFVKRYHPNAIEQIYQDMSESRRKLIEPIYEPSDVFVKKWREKEYNRKGFDEDELESGARYFTDDGNRVRSKSEIIIGNKLVQMGVPYRYEYPLRIGENSVFHPDFFCLNVRTRKEFVWEHFGMMDDEEYASRALCKIEEYQKEGYWFGINFMVSFESSSHIINIQLIEKMIRRYLL